MCGVYPVAFPIAKLLDHLLEESEDDNMYSRTELAALIRIQYEERLAAKQRRRQERHDVGAATSFDHVGPLDFSYSQQQSLRALKSEFIHAGNSFETVSSQNKHRRGSSIHIDEVNIMEGALQMKTKVAFDIYTPLKKVFLIPHDMLLNEKNVVRIYSSGYSRLPVYKGASKSAVCGILMTRQLIMVKPDENWSVSKVPLNIPMCVSPKTNLVDLINLFQTGGQGGKGGHMALVCAQPDVGNLALDDNDPIPPEAGLIG
jgi:metal transporter CNNM